tara:strand:- start:190 stop:1236 length:1047 start_codon:yes stop_codon:yes gene_type:complete
MPFDTIIGHDRPKQILQAGLRKEQFSHAYLFFGNKGIGKSLTAKMLAQTINCEEPVKNGSDACGQCWSCTQIENAVHPDVFCTAPMRFTKDNIPIPDARLQIKIEQVREMQEHLVYRALIGRYKIYIVDDADRMNKEAANCLLKTLEEPPDHSLIFLISSRPQHLLPTIRSRCQKLRFTPLSLSAIQETLERQQQRSADDARLTAGFSQGSLGVAFETNPIEVRKERDHIVNTVGIDSLMQGGILQIFSASEALTKSNFTDTTLTWLTHWLRDILILQISNNPERLMNKDRFTDLAQAGERCTPKIIIDLLETIQSMRQGLRRNLNAQVQMEVFLLKLHDAFEIPTSP